MSNNCLVTKLKGRVQNNNLPVFNKSISDYLGRVDESSSSTTIAIMTDPSATNNVILRSAVDMHINIESGDITREVTSTPGTYKALVASKAELGANPILNLIEIDNIYDLCKLSFGAGIDYKKAKSSIEGILKYGKVYAFGAFIGTEHEVPVAFSSNIVEYLNLIIDNSNDNAFAFDLSNCANMPSLKVIGINSFNSIYPPIVTNIPGGVEYISGIRFKNDVANFPASIKGITSNVINTSVAYGSLESFVEKARANGRSSGYLIIPSTGLVYATNITFNGVSLSSYIAATPPPSVTVGSNLYYALTWDATTISWGDTAPEDALDIANMGSVFRYNKKQ